MTLESKLYDIEATLKTKHLDIMKKLSHTELKQFQKMEYKKIVLSEMSKLLPEYRKKQYDQTALCVVNFLQSEVQSLLKTPQNENHSTTTVDSNLLSETILHELDSPLLSEHEESDIENDKQNCTISEVQGEVSGENLDDSITLLKEAANSQPTQTQSDKDQNVAENQVANKSNQCCDSCKVKPASKKKYDMIRCTFCMHWYHETCVGIRKDDPIGIWVCVSCRNVPKDIKQDIYDLKHEVGEIKQSTNSILRAIENIYSKLSNGLENVNDRITSVARQINSKELCITESLESLQTVTNGLKTSFDQKSCQIINKTTAVFEKVKAHEENFKNIKMIPDQHQDQQTMNPNKTQNRPSKPDYTKPKNNTNLTNAKSKKIRKPMEETKVTTPKPKYQTEKTTQHSSPGELHSTNDEHEVIDLTNKPTKVIHKPTLLVGSSILKGVKTSDLNPNVAIKSFPGATTDSIKDSLSDYDTSKCNTIILHVGGNDADSGADIETFCDSYVSLLENLQTDDRRLVVSGLLPRESVDLEPYNNKLKALCAENDLEFINHYDSFLLASGDIPDAYFHKDKTHLNMSGTRKFLMNIESVCKVRNVMHPVNRNEHGNRSVKGYQGPRTGRRAPPRAGPRYSQKYCHICAMKNHSTKECWFNGRNSGMPSSYSG